MKEVAFWTSLDFTCRLLGIATGAVLIGVGTETLLQGQFKSLAVYLLFSGVAVSVYEAAYFASLLLTACSALPAGFTMHACWKEVRRCRAFQKFLAYVLLSVACFLHPVLVWHVTIPGTMLVLTGLAYFLLSKRHKETAANGQPGQCSDSCHASAAEMGVEDMEQTYTFSGGACRGQQDSLLGYVRSILRSGNNQESAVNSSNILMARRQVHFEEKVVNLVLSVQENTGSLSEENMSDTAPILGPAPVTSP
ncbi:transmembrane protein 72 [Eublepharis macularius]|uniref:Transmembrane protein 72 n=1 Tax=Eublepharis macularius TaxID=481883 RepID=A0AA97L2J9_EUBMA|nr:transmembrane protein 72 [Eublepharis macularius]